MTNKEYYKERIFKIACQGDSIAFDNRINCIVDCSSMDCSYCKFSNQGGCKDVISKWLEEEYVEPPVDWSKVEIDAKILVRYGEDEEWTRRYFAKYKNGKVYAFKNGLTSWSVDDADNSILDWEYAKLWED